MSYQQIFLFINIYFLQDNCRKKEDLGEGGGHEVELRGEGSMFYVGLGLLGVRAAKNGGPKPKKS